MTRKRPSLPTVYSQRGDRVPHSSEPRSNVHDRPVLIMLGGVGVGSPETVLDRLWVPNTTGNAELLRGWLPDSQMKAVQNAGFTDLILGTNQSAIGSVLEGMDYIRENGGVDMTGYGTSQRFLLFDHTYQPDFIKRAVDEGYFGPRGGFRIVVAMPLATEARKRQQSLVAENPEFLWANGFLPEDIFGGEGVTVTGFPKSVVTEKYVAGLVNDGQYFMNPGFMQEK